MLNIVSHSFMPRQIEAIAPVPRPHDRRRTTTPLERTVRMTLMLLVLLFAGAANAIPNCTYTTSRTYTVLYDGRAVSSFGSEGIMSCTNMPGNGGSTAFSGCLSSDAASSLGTGGGTSANPTRTARSAEGNTLQYQLIGAFSGLPLTASNIQYASISFPTNGSASTLFSNSSDGAGPTLINITAGQAPPVGDYVSTVPLTISTRYQNGSSPPSCTGGSLANSSIVNIPVRIRVGAVCAYTDASNMNFGAITVNAGTVDATPYALASAIRMSCTSGTNYTITLSDGNQASGTGVNRRRMVNGSSFLAYGLYSDFDATVPFTSVNGTGTGANANVYVIGKIPSQSAAGLTSGVYRDTVIAFLTY